MADDKAAQWCFYRYHVPDPIYFWKDVRVTIQQIGWYDSGSRESFEKAGRTLFVAGPGRVEMDLSKSGKFERADDWSSCAYFYLDRPERATAPLTPVENRT